MHRSGILNFVFRLAALLTVSTSPSWAEEIDNNYAQGMCYLNVAKYEKSLPYLSKCIQAKHNLADALAARAKAYYYLSHFQAAIEDSDNALKINPKQMFAWRYKVRSEFMSKQVPKGIADCDGMLRALPHFLPAYELKVEGLKKLARDFEAKKVAQQSPAALRTSEFYQRGGVYMDAEQYQPDLDSYSKYLIVSPYDVDAYFSRAQCYRQLGHNDKALADLTKTIELAPDEVDNWQARAQTYARLGKLQEAARDYQSLLEVDPGTDAYHIERAAVLRQLHQYDKALKEYNQILVISPDDEDVFRYRADCYMGLGQYDKAVADYTTAIARDPDLAEFYAARARAYEKLGKKELAEKDRQKAKLVGSGK